MLGRSAEVPVPCDATVVDLRGRYLIPGLWDMHMHTSYSDIDLPLEIANGVTSVREMWGHPWVRDWQRQVEDGTLLGPRFVVGSAIIDGSPTLWNDPKARPSAPIVVTTAEQARRAVRSEVRDGASFIKVYSRLPHDALRALADECDRHGVRFGGHCPDAVSVEDAAGMGMWTFEHLDGLWWSTSSRHAELHRAVANIRVDPTEAYDSWFRQIGVLEWTAATSYDDRRAEHLFARLRRRGSWQVPTLSLNRRIDMPDGSGDPRMKYVPAGDAAYWAQFSRALAATRTAVEVQQHRVLFERRMRLVGAMADAEVPILAGTDTGTTYLFPGFSLHDELDLLVQSGLSPMRALQAATYEPAKALGIARNAGTIGVGKIADLVALDADPLADIRNAQRIHAVVARGRLITAAARRALLDDAQRAAAREQGDLVVYMHTQLRASGADVSARNAAVQAIFGMGEDYHEGSTGVELDAGLGRRASDVVVTKRRASAFAGTDLAMVLRAAGVDTLLVAGVATSAMVAATVYAAADRDLRVRVARDVCADPVAAVHEFLVGTLFPARGVDIVSDI